MQGKGLDRENLFALKEVVDNLFTFPDYSEMGEEASDLIELSPEVEAYEGRSVWRRWWSSKEEKADYQRKHQEDVAHFLKRLNKECLEEQVLILQERIKSHKKQWFLQRWWQSDLLIEQRNQQYQRFYLGRVLELLLKQQSPEQFGLSQLSRKANERNTSWSIPYLYKEAIKGIKEQLGLNTIWSRITGSLPKKVRLVRDVLPNYFVGQFRNIIAKLYNKWTKPKIQAKVTPSTNTNPKRVRVEPKREKEAKAAEQTRTTIPAGATTHPTMAAPTSPATEVVTNKEKAGTLKEGITRALGAGIVDYKKTREKKSEMSRSKILENNPGLLRSLLGIKQEEADSIKVEELIKRKRVLLSLIHPDKLDLLFKTTEIGAENRALCEEVTKELTQLEVGKILELCGGSSAVKGREGSKGIEESEVSDDLLRRTEELLELIKRKDEELKRDHAELMARYDAIDKKYDDIDKKYDDIAKDRDEIAKGCGALAKKQDGMEKQLTTLTTQVQVLTSWMTSSQGDLPPASLANTVQASESGTQSVAAVVFASASTTPRSEGVEIEGNCEV